MFDGVVERYDLVNDLLSLGLDRWWRRQAARAVAPALRGGPVLDLGCGTGKLGALLAKRARVVGVDVSHRMLVRARRVTKGSEHLVEGSAFSLPFPDRMFDAAVSGFVLRNLDDLPRALAELHRVMGPGGSIALMDITEPRNTLFRRLFDAYFGTVAPALGGVVGRRAAYRYLVRSLAHLPPPQGVCRLLEEAGFERSRARPLSGGMVTLFTGSRGG